jgi:hypothetical protein
MPKDRFELALLPTLFSIRPWTAYLKDMLYMITRGLRCVLKYPGEIGDSQVAIVYIRPDGYVGSIKSWDVVMQTSSEVTARWVDEY